MDRIYTVASGKGGCGKSSLCALLGAAFARGGKRVLLVETDSGLRALDILLQVSDRAAFDLGDALTGRCSLEEAPTPCPEHPGLFLLPAPFDHRFLPEPQAFCALLAKFAERFDLILIDTPAGVGPMLQTALAACDTALLAVTPDPVCMRDAARVRQLVPRARLVINRFEPRRLAVPDLDTVIDTVGAQLLGVVPEDPAVYDLACSGTPLPASSHARQATEAIAARLLGRRVALLFP